MLAAATFALLSAAIPPPPPFPAALLHPVTTVYFGTAVADPYRSLERLHDPAVQAWFRSEARYSNDLLAKLGPPREALRTRIRALSVAGTSISSLTPVGNSLVYLERPPSANDARLMVRASSPRAVPRLLVDPDALGKAAGNHVHLTLTNVVPSDDARYIAYGVIPGGAERSATGHIVETATGRILPDTLPRTWDGITAWSDDTTVVYYNQLIALQPGEDEADAELRSQLLRHVIGTPAQQDVSIFGYGVDPNVPFVPTDAPSLTLSPMSPWAIGAIEHGVQNELTLYAAPKSSLGTLPIPWRKIVDVADAVTGYDLRGDTIYLLTHRGAPHYKVTALDLSLPNATAARARTIVSESATIVQQIVVARDALYVRSATAGIGKIAQLAWSDRAPGRRALTPVKLPFDGTVDELSTDPQRSGAVFRLTSWTKPPVSEAIAADGSVADLHLAKPPAIDTTPYVSEEVTCASTGGVRVPLSIVRRKDTKLDGSAPAYLTGYGAYGISFNPAFLGTQLAWLDRGGIFAVAHVRGGGELGEAWYRAGKGATKQHTIDDAVAAARYLIAHHYTSASHLTLEGTSAGGILVTGAVTKHPELFAAALDVVGVGDALRSENEPNGPGNTPEFGSVATRAGFEALYAMDAYAHIVDGRRYPAVMGITGINDPRVAPWQVAKFVARLRHASSSGRPVIMRVDYDAGHGFLAASREQAVALKTDELSFLLWQTGSPAFAGVERGPARFRLR